MRYFLITILIAAAKAAGHEDPCECLGAENLPTDYFVEKGYSELYGTECLSWDSKEPYCQEGGEYFGADWCSVSYSWCYVDKACESALDTIFFAGTEHEDKLAYATTPCEDPCSCVGPENLPTDYFVEQGYSEEYGTSCEAWDAQ